jgi:Ser/Thr protein kinase RdoA (MazF antagonist)
MRLGVVTAFVAILAALPAGAAAAPATKRCADDKAARCGSVSVPLVRLSGAATGTLRIAWSTRATRALASLRGTLGGRTARLRTPAP